MCVCVCVCEVLNSTFRVTTEYTQLRIAQHKYYIVYQYSTQLYISTGRKRGEEGGGSLACKSLVATYVYLHACVCGSQWVCACVCNLFMRV